MTAVAFLGTGAMGSRMAARLIDAGHDVTVWNRTSARTAALSKIGATVAATPRRAAARADVVFSMVRDDEASKSVWLEPDTGALGGLRKDAVALECSTLSVPWVRDLAGAFREAERVFLDAPLAGSRPQAEEGRLIFFAGGEADALGRVKPLLDQMGAAVHHAGGQGAGAAVKLMVNALFGAQLGVMAELVGFAEKAGIDAGKAVDILGSTPVCSPAAKLSADAMLAGAWEPAFPIDLVAKDFGLVERSATDVSAELPLAGAARAVYERAVAAGHGADNITGIVQLYSQSLR